MRVHFRLDTHASPEQVFAAFTDVSERRLEVWSTTLDPATYEVREPGAGWAVVREGGAGVHLWVALRYEWAAPDRVTWTLVDSDHCDRGTGEVLIAPRDGGGGRGLRGRAVLLTQGVIGPLAFPRAWRSALDRTAA